MAAWSVVGRWWDGSWSPRWRRDIRLSTDGAQRRLEARQGTGGEWWCRDYGSEAAARAAVAGMLERTTAAGVVWTDLTDITTSGPANRGRWES